MPARDDEGRGHRLAGVGQQDERERHAVQRRVEGEEQRRRARRHLVDARGEEEHEPELGDHQPPERERVARDRDARAPATTRRRTRRAP